jgi:20S proteasome alpha/beta subunit
MTIGIGAICDEGKAIVLVTDRMVSLSAMGLNFDGEQRKMIALLPGIGVAATGTFDESESVLERLRHSAELMAPAAVRPVAERLHQLCGRLRWQQIERQITRPWLRMGFRKFSEQCAIANTTPPVAEAFKAVQNFKPQLALLVAGIDAYGAHLYTVTYENVVSHTGTGFIVIGSGTFTGTDFLVTRRKFFRTRSVAETIYSMYEVKRASECVTGVGPATEVGIIRQGEKMVFLSPEQIEVLGRIYERMKPPKLSVDDSSTIASFLDQPPTPPTPPDPTPPMPGQPPL